MTDPELVYWCGVGICLLAIKTNMYKDNNRNAGCPQMKLGDAVCMVEFLLCEITSSLGPLLAKYAGKEFLL